MTDWFARPVLHVTDVEASLRFYVDRLGFTAPGATTRTVERMSHKSTDRAAR
jgi:catechol 2,3-dioxygenase-like lactoylglutathione lyase family enzyme